ELLLGLLPTRHVAGDLGDADDPPGVVLDRRDRQRDVDDDAVLAEPLRLVAGDPLAPADTLEDAGDLVALTGRHEQADVPADGLLGGIAEDPLGPGVPARDHAVKRLADDGVVG